MAPTIRPNRDIVVLQPQEFYDGEGIYAINSDGDMAIYRCQKFGNNILMSSDSNFYKANHKVSLTWFDEAVIAKCLGVVVRFDGGQGL